MDSIRTVSFVKAWCDLSSAAAADIIEALEFGNADRVKISFEQTGQYFVLEGRRKDVEQSAASLSKEIHKGISVERKTYDISEADRKFKVPRFANMRQPNIKWTRNPESNIIDTEDGQPMDGHSVKWRWEPQYLSTFEKIVSRSGFNTKQFERAYNCKLDVDPENGTILVKASSDFVVQELREILEKLTEIFNTNWKSTTAHVLYPLTRKSFLLRFAAISKQKSTIMKTTMMPNPELQNRLDKLYTIRLLTYEPSTQNYERCQFDVEPVSTASTFSQPRDWVGFSFKEWARENAPANIVPKVTTRPDDDHAEELAIRLANLAIADDRTRNSGPSWSNTGGRRLKPKKGQETATTATSVVEGSSVSGIRNGADGPRLVPPAGAWQSLPTVLDRTQLWVNEPGIWNPVKPTIPAQPPVESQEPSFFVAKQPKIDQNTGQFSLGSKPVEMVAEEEVRPATTRKLKARKKKTLQTTEPSAQGNGKDSENRTYISGTSSQKAGLQKYFSSEEEIITHNRKTLRSVIKKGLDMAAYCKLDFKLSLDFGRIALEIPKKDTKKDFPWTELDNSFKALKNDLTTYWTDRLTKEHYDAEFLTDLRLPKLGGLFSNIISQRVVCYFHGTFFGESCSISIDAETFETQAFGSSKEFSTVYCHFPGHSWDTALKLQGRQVLDKNMPEFAEFLQSVYIQPGKFPVVTYTQKEDAKLQVDTVILQRKTRHIVLHESLTAGKEILLNVVENQNLRITEHTANPYLKRAEGRDREALRSRDRIWYTFSLVPTPENDILAAARDLQLGEKASWDANDILGFRGTDELVERLLATASEVVTRIDCIGCPREEIDSGEE